MSNQQNDLSLLRPFNLEAAKSGEEVISIFNENTPGVFVGMDTKGTICIDRKHHGLSLWTKEEFYILRMKPLCWVEGKPVYKGDILWDNECGLCIKVEGYNPHIEDKSGVIGTLLESTKFGGEVGTKTWAPIIVWSWNKPKQKVKLKIWINVYPDGELCTYYSKIDADVGCSSERIACVETEIECEV